MCLAHTNTMGATQSARQRAAKQCCQKELCLNKVHASRCSSITGEAPVPQATALHTPPVLAVTRNVDDRFDISQAMAPTVCIIKASRHWASVSNDLKHKLDICD